jgi:hypothetical protein
MVNEEEKMKKIKIVMAFVLISLSASVQAEELIEIEVYRSPNCGCCSKWLGHLKANQFLVKDIVTNDVQAIKDKYGVSSTVSSCHTALVNGYVIEGHVPAADIKKLLKIKPAVTGISVAGMPAGTPGMEMGNKKDAYDVISFDKENNYQVFSSYDGK